VFLEQYMVVVLAGKGENWKTENPANITLRKKSLPFFGHLNDFQICTQIATYYIPKSTASAIGF
jgi:hypothetical protein